MNLLLLTAAIAAVIGGGESKPAPQEKRLFEIRTYWAAPGKLEALHARFRDHTTKLFQKHGITNIGYWTPVENPDSKLIYILAFPSKEAHDKSWKEFGDDPEWKAAYTASEKDGKLVTKIESVFLNATDYSSVPKLGGSARKPRVFELRTYNAAPGKMDDLNTRFRTVTMRLIAKYGATNLAYWQPVEKGKDGEEKLIYLLAHKSQEAAKESGEKFGKDPEWIAAKEASEKNGMLVKSRESIFLKPTDYSPLK